MSLLAVVSAFLGNGIFSHGYADEATTAHSESAAPSPQATREGLLTLINGDIVQGSVRPAAAVDSIGWQGTNFDRPFEFRLSSVRSIKFPSESREDVQPATLSFELTNGDVIQGQLLRLSDESIDIGCPSLGTVSIRTDNLRRFYRLEPQANVAFSALRGMEGWTNVSGDAPGWREDGDHVWTEQPDAVLIGDVQLPRRAAIELELSWEDKPDFVIALAIDPARGDDAARDGWRLETAGDALVAVCEEGPYADVVNVADLSKVGRIRLIVQLDQVDRSMQVLQSDGSLLGAISLRRDGTNESGLSLPASSTPRGAVRLINRGRSLRLERFQVSQWLGTGPRAAIPKGHVVLTLVDGSEFAGRIAAYEASNGVLQLAEGEAGTSRDILLADVVTARFTPPIASVEAGRCAWFLNGSMRISGNFLAVDDQGWVLDGDSFLGEIRLPHDQVRTLVVFESDSASVETKPVLGRVGRLELGADRLSGRLVPSDSSTASANSLLTWHPLYSSVAAAFRAELSGRIVYRDAQKVDTQSTAARMLEQQRLRNQQQRRGLNFGELFLQRSDLSKSNPVNRNAHVVHCRSGDVIPCRVDAMDESGVLVSTADSGRGLIPHEKIKAVEFVSNSPPPSIDQAKRERLLTIPRLQKSDPPTHLLCSHNGDFLRCNVIRTENDQLRVQIQSEETLIPRNRIAQIIWFHRDEYDSELPSESEPLDQQTRDQASNNESSDEYRGLVQAVLADGKRATFTPATVVDGFIDGVSPWVGQCRFDLGSVDQLLIGSLIKEDVVEFAYNQWKLRRAVEPLVTAAMQGDQPGSGGAQSPLVGMPAPDLSLLLLDGTEFDLAGNQGQIIVLGFWASWSAPSMELLPQVIEAVGEFDSGLVRLVTVNLQESAEQVRTALTRQQLQPLVALDRDGVAAERFQATVVPQLVIVGADGVVKGLHIGGGPEVMPRLKEQIAQLLDSTIPSPP